MGSIFIQQVAQLRLSLRLQLAQSTLRVVEATSVTNVVQKVERRQCVEAKQNHTAKMLSPNNAEKHQSGGHLEDQAKTMLSHMISTTQNV